MGANPLTFSGLAGLGDLLATCASTLSRNHHVGVELAKGRRLDDIVKTMKGVAEGVSTTTAAWSLARELGVEMPITEQMHRVLNEGIDVRTAAAELLGAQARHELAGRRWRLFSANPPAQAIRAAGRRVTRRVAVGERLRRSPGQALTAPLATSSFRGPSSRTPGCPPAPRRGVSAAWRGPPA